MSERVADAYVMNYIAIPGQGAIDKIVIEAVERVFNIKYDTWMQKNEKGKHSREYEYLIPRQTMIYLLKKYTPFRERAISKIFNLDRSTVYHATKVILSTYIHDAEFGESIKRAENIVSQRVQSLKKNKK
jgi:chromosomal replication initiation ATPase DnaA